MQYYHLFPPHTLNARQTFPVSAPTVKDLPLRAERNRTIAFLTAFRFAPLHHNVNNPPVKTRFARLKKQRHLPSLNSARFKEGNHPLPPAAERLMALSAALPMPSNSLCPTLHIAPEGYRLPPLPLRWLRHLRTAPGSCRRSARHDRPDRSSRCQWYSG